MTTGFNGQSPYKVVDHIGPCWYKADDHLTSILVKPLKHPNLCPSDGRTERQGEYSILRLGLRGGGGYKNIYLY